MLEILMIEPLPCRTIAGTKALAHRKESDHVSLGAFEPVLGGLRFKTPPNLHQSTVDQNIQTANFSKDMILQALDGLFPSDIQFQPKDIQSFLAC
jgi:hypothetical protein